MDSEGLPDGWATCTLGDLIPKPRPKVQADPASDFPFIGMDHIEADSFHLTGQARFADMRSAGSYFLPNDILYGRLRPYLNKVHRAKFEGVASAEFIVLPSADHFDSDFIKYLLHRGQFVDFAMSKSSGDRPPVKFDGIAAYEFALPPLAEQQRIVEKIETLFAELDKGEEALREVQKLLARYRQSVLKAAVTGTLTADWRAANGPAQESGKDLLARILKTRRETWQGRGQYKEPVEPNTDGLPGLPDGWSWASLDQLISRVEAGKNYRCEERPPEADETGIVKISAVTWEEFDEEESKTILKADHVDDRYFIQTGDLLISRANTLELVGASVVVGDIRRRLQLSDKVLRLRCVTPIEHWLNFVLRSPLGRGQIERMATGAQMSMRNISQKNLARICIPLPPKNEIEKLVTKIADLRNVAKRMLETCEYERKRSAALRQSILKNAFSGKLVPQDPSDEPADKLLERIRAARAEEPKAKRKKATA